MINYYDLNELEIEAILKVYDPSIIKFRKYDFLDLFSIHCYESYEKIMNISRFNEIYQDLIKSYRVKRINTVIYG